MITTVARHQGLALRRQRIGSLAITVLIALAVLAGALGWSSHHTIVRVFDQAIKLQAEAGKPAPSNPFLLQPDLAPLSNLVVYIALIGALVALVLGHVAVEDDLGGGTGRLVFSRLARRSHYVLGKLVGTCAFVAAGLIASALVSVLAVLVVNHRLSITDVTRLSGFFALSWLYLTLFVLVGMLTPLLTRRRSLALLSAIGIWLVITFVVPQVTSGLRPTQSLNPLSEPVGTSQAFFRVTHHASALSLSEQYKHAAGAVLGTAPDASATGAVVTLALAVILLACLVVALMTRTDVTKGGADE